MAQLRYLYQGLGGCKKLCSESIQNVTRASIWAKFNGLVEDSNQK